MKILLIFFILNTDAAPSSRGEVVDLGNIEIEGQVQEPLFQMIESDEKARQLLKESTARSLVELETQLLAPRPFLEQTKE